MNSKWYFNAFLLALAILGISLGQSTVPNQEIVVQFNDGEVTSEETQDAISIVKKQLRSIGVENIQVVEELDGKLKITYYSDVAVAVVQRIFSEEKEFELVYNPIDLEKELPELPFSSSSKSYKLNVCEIVQGGDADLDFNGYVPELKAGNDRYFNPDVYVFVDALQLRLKNEIENVSYALHRSNALLISNSEHCIPEVRAGPMAQGIS